MPQYTVETGAFAEEARGEDRELRRTLNRGKPGLATDLEMLDKQLGMLSQAVTALSKVLDPVLGPEQSKPELASGPQDSVERDVVHTAPLRERVAELADGVAKVRKRIEALSERIEL